MKSLYFTIVDLFSRFFLFLHTQYYLQSSPPIEKLEKTSNSHEFCWRVMPFIGRNLSLALALLPSDERREARTAYLLARVLDAFEDLSQDTQAGIQGIDETIAYLCENKMGSPSIKSLSARRDSDRVEILLVQKLPLIRDEFRRLDSQSHDRILHTLIQMATGMKSALSESSLDSKYRNTQKYSDKVLGGSVQFALGQIEGTDSIPSVLCGIAGKVLQIGNNIRDYRFDQCIDDDRGVPDRAELFVEIFGELPLVSHLLQLIPFPRYSGARGAASILTLTTADFFAKELGVEEKPFRLKLPRYYSLLSIVSNHHYLKNLEASETAIASCFLPSSHFEKSDEKRVPILDLGCNSPLQQFELSLSQTILDEEVASEIYLVTVLVNQVRNLLSQLPKENLSKSFNSVHPVRLLVADQLLASAWERVADMPLQVSEAFSQMLSDISKNQCSTKGGELTSDLSITSFLAKVLALDYGIWDRVDSWVHAHSKLVNRLSQRPLNYVDGESLDGSIRQDLGEYGLDYRQIQYFENSLDAALRTLNANRGYVECA